MTTAHPNLNSATRRPASGSTPAWRGRAPHALKVAESSFRLLVSGPSPLAVDGSAVGYGLPARQVDLGELRELLLAPGAGDALKDAAWRELIARARTGQAAWVVGCVGVALPGLCGVASRVCATAPPALAEDIVSELLTEFLAQLGRVEVDRPHIIERLLLWARKGALRARGRELRQQRLDPGSAHWLTPAPNIGVHGPEAVLAEAVRLSVISGEAAETIAATRLHGLTVTDYAHATGAAPKRLYSLRERAEARLAAAIGEGHVWVMTLTGAQNPGR